MKNGDHVKIVRDSSGHNIPENTPMIVIAITDDDLRLWDGSKFHYVNEDDVEIINPVKK